MSDCTPLDTSHVVMNQIPQLQNEKQALALLAAQRQRYANAKRILGWQLFLGGPVGALVAVLGIVEPSVRLYAVSMGLTILVLDTLWLSPWQRRLRESGARIQERFDCDVLSLRWDSTRVGSPEPMECIHEQSERYKAWAESMPPLTDWYSRHVGQLPLSLARLVCQRTNCWWDATQRRTYAAVLAGLLLALPVLLLWVGVVAKLSVADLLLVVLLPMSTTVKLAYQQWVENREAASRLDNLREQAERIWERALSAPYDPALEHDARALQGEIFDNRKRSPPVFDFVFKWLRNDQESQMNFAAEHYVSEAVRRMRTT